MGKHGFNPRYDSWRPEDDPSRPELHRRPSGRDEVMRQQEWRREQPKERRPRRSSLDDTHFQVVADALASPIDHSHVKKQRSRSRANSTVSLPGSSMARRPMFPPHCTLSTSVIESPPLPDMMQFATPVFEHPNPDLATGSNKNPSAIKTSDPRLNRPHHVGATQLALVKPPTTLLLEPTTVLRDREMTDLDVAHFTTEHTTAIITLREEQKELKALSLRLTKLEESINLAKSRLPSKVHSPYTGVILEEIRGLKNKIIAQKAHIEALREEENAARKALAKFHNQKDGPSSDVKELRRQLDEAQSHSKLLKDENQELQAQMSQTNDDIDHLKHLVANIAEELAQNMRQSSVNEQQLKTMGKSIPSGTQDDLVQLREELQRQKLAVARLNDVCVDRESFTMLTTQVNDLGKRTDNLHTQIEISSGKQLTQDYLNDYIAMFNKFETKTDGRIRSLEGQPTSNVDFNGYVRATDLAQQINSRLAEHNVSKAMSQRLDSIESHFKTIKDWSNVITSCSKNYEQMQVSLSTVIQEFQMLSQRMKVLGEAVNRISAEVPNDTMENLKNEVLSLRETSNKLEVANNRNAHSIGSLSQRCNNIGTDQLARQMLGVLDPMLATIKPQIQTLLASSVKLAQVEKDITAVKSKFDEQYTVISKKLELDQKHASEREQVDKEKITDLEVSVTAGARTIETLVNNFQKLHDEVTNQCKAGEESTRKYTEELLQSSVTRIESSLGEVRDNVATSKEAFEGAIKTSKQEYDHLYNHVKEIRDGFNMRLAPLEKRLPDIGSTDSVSKQASPPQLVIKSYPPPVPAPRSSSHQRNSHTKLPKAKPLPKSSLVEHFPRRIRDEYVNDTIDATPRPRGSTSKGDKDGIVTISDSESEVPTDPTGETTDSDDVAIDLDKWKIGYIQSPSIQDKAKGGKLTKSNKPREVSSVGKTVSIPKRKRDPSSVTPRSSQASNGDTPTVIPKKPKT